MKRIIASILLLAAAAAASAQTLRVTSPDGRQEASVDVISNGGNTEITYRTWFDGRPVVLPSVLDLTIDNHIWEKALAKKADQVDRWFNNLVYESHETFSKDTVWSNPYGERSQVRDAYNGAILHFVKRDASKYRLDIEIRAYDEGIALRYCLPMHPDAIYHRILAENTEFAFPDGTQAWYTQWAQAPYELLPLNDWPDECERPLTLKLADDLYAAVGEAAQIDFPRGKLKLSEIKANTVVTALNDNGTDIVTPYALPWRVIMASDRLGGLLENNDIYLNLNEASAIADETWVRPGKIMRETRLTTENSIKCIDFCAAHDIDYILYDWKWYGRADDFNSDAGKVVAPIDMNKVVEYGKSKGVGVWVYVNQHALQKQAEEIFPIYKEWGLAGIKFGFVQFTSQHWADWVHRMVRLAADNNLMVNIHDEYRPTGYSRTYPNLLTQEGIRGNEEFPSATHNTILPFTRMICGAGDYTVCYFDPRLKNTHAHQLTFPVMYFSPLQTLYWYDTPDRIKDVPELEFFDNVPVVWDETKVVDDAIGEHVVIARRSGAEWFAGAITNDEGRRLSVATGFLEQDKDYVLRVYTDDPSSDSPTKVKCARYIVKGGQVLTFDLQPKGGAAMHFIPAEKADLKAYKKLKVRDVL
ncbi:MAG: glycoside hydrolase family 97 catalytic domain-containing protein [Bacteroidales bacterium]|nr:glycoside hydrolase family 97 catalytic domain-containing protein [Bacteroidales bacterium]MBO5942724.1 glycoside hydrolase family 97 catalytic domain-containing protein [Bacteroidales bacterium]